MKDQKMTHTPGPWGISPDNKTLIISDHCISVAETTNYGPEWKREANARLIAAAPELLAMLKAYVEANETGHCLDHFSDKEAQKLIAKAEGK